MCLVSKNAASFSWKMCIQELTKCISPQGRSQSPKNESGQDVKMTIGLLEKRQRIQYQEKALFFPRIPYHTSWGKILIETKQQMLQIHMKVWKWYVLGGCVVVFYCSVLHYARLHLAKTCTLGFLAMVWALGFKTLESRFKTQKEIGSLKIHDSVKFFLNPFPSLSNFLNPHREALYPAPLD